MADQKLSPSDSSHKTEIPAKTNPGKRAVLYARISTGDQNGQVGWPEVLGVQELCAGDQACTIQELIRAAGPTTRHAGTPAGPAFPALSDGCSG
jgi:hypothetical protein